MKVTQELLADAYRRGLTPVQISAEVGCSAAHVLERTTRFGLRPEYERVVAGMEAERIAAKTAAKDALKRAQLRNERERWLETCRANYAKWEPIVSVQEAGPTSIHRTASRRLISRRSSPMVRFPDLAFDADLGACLAFGADISLRCRILAHKHGGQPGHATGLFA